MSQYGHQRASVSVVIPTFNGADFIDDALESVFRQTLPPREIIVVDDASTDTTPQRVAATAARAPVPITLIRLPANSGSPARPINTGVQAASGSWIAVLDQDDLFVAEKLDKQTRVLRDHPDVSFVFSLYDRLGICPGPPESVRSLARMRRLLPPRVVSDECWKWRGEQMLRLLLSRGNCLGGFPAFLFRRSDWQRKGGLDESLTIAADYDMFCWLSRERTVALVPEVLYHHRDHAANLSRRRGLCHLDIVAVLCKYLPCLEQHAARRQVRRTISRYLYQLSLDLATSNQRAAAMQLLLSSHRIEGLSWKRLFALLMYPLRLLSRRGVDSRTVLTSDQATLARQMAQHALALSCARRPSFC